MPAASLTKVDTTSQSWLVLPKTQGITGYRCVCLSRAAQLQSWGLAVSLVSLSQACCLHRRHSCATSAFCAIEAVLRKVCWLTCCVRKDRSLNTDLRFALAPMLVPVAGPTVTYGPYCTTQLSSLSVSCLHKPSTQLLPQLHCAHAQHCTDCLCNQGKTVDSSRLLSLTFKCGVDKAVSKDEQTSSCASSVLSTA